MISLKSDRNGPLFIRVARGSRERHRKPYVPAASNHGTRSIWHSSWLGHCCSLPSDHCPVRINRRHRDDTAVGEEYVAARTISVHDGLRSPTANLITLRQILKVSTPLKIANLGSAVEPADSIDSRGRPSALSWRRCRLSLANPRVRSERQLLN